MNIVLAIFTAILLAAFIAARYSAWIVFALCIGAWCGLAAGLWLRPLWDAPMRHRCNHKFAIEDLTQLPGAKDDAVRVLWTCNECHETFTGHCGLQIAAANNGTIFRRGQAPNAGNNLRESRRDERQVD